MCEGFSSCSTDKWSRKCRSGKKKIWWMMSKFSTLSLLSSHSTVTTWGVLLCKRAQLKIEWKVLQTKLTYIQSVLCCQSGQCSHSFFLLISSEMQSSQPKIRYSTWLRGYCSPGPIFEEFVHFLKKIKQLWTKYPIIYLLV